MKKNLKYNIAWVAIAAVVYGVLLALYNGDSLRYLLMRLLLILELILLLQLV